MFTWALTSAYNFAMPPHYTIANLPFTFTMLLPFGSPRKSDESFSWLSNLRQVTPTALLSGDSLAWETCAAMN